MKGFNIVVSDARQCTFLYCIFLSCVRLYTRALC
jgi:hypothetical protein